MKIVYKTGSAKSTVKMVDTILAECFYFQLSTVNMLCHRPIDP
jgi:hypothetical protein